MNFASEHRLQTKLRLELLLKGLGLSLLMLTRRFKLLFKFRKLQVIGTRVICSGSNWLKVAAAARTAGSLPHIIIVIRFLNLASVQSIVYHTLKYSCNYKLLTIWWYLQVAFLFRHGKLLEATKSEEKDREEKNILITTRCCRIHRNDITRLIIEKRSRWLSS